jgi:hypothetical protein
MDQVAEPHPAGAAGRLLHPPLPPDAEVRDQGDLRDPGQVPHDAPPAPRLVPESGLQGRSSPRMLRQQDYCITSRMTTFYDVGKKIFFKGPFRCEGR